MKPTKQDLKQLIESKAVTIFEGIHEGGGIAEQEINVVSVKDLKEFMEQFDEI